MDIGRVEFSDPRFHNTDIPLVPDKRDAPSWARLRELEEEVRVLTGKVAMLERDRDDMEERLSALHVREAPADPVHEAKEDIYR